jgi:hypothetical protein
LTGAGEVGQPTGHHRVAQAVLHRLAEPKVRGVRQRRDELGDANLATIGHA